MYKILFKLNILNGAKPLAFLCIFVCHELGFVIIEKSITR